MNCNEKGICARPSSHSSPWPQRLRPNDACESCGTQSCNLTVTPPAGMDRDFSWQVRRERSDVDDRTRFVRWDALGIADSYSWDRPTTVPKPLTHLTVQLLLIRNIGGAKISKVKIEIINSEKSPALVFNFGSQFLPFVLSQCPELLSGGLWVAGGRSINSHNQ